MYRDEELPKTIGNGQYQLKRRLGQGGMAAVYLAEVDLDCFDYALVVAGHESAKGDTEEERVAQRKRRYQQWVKKSRAELTQLCDKFKLPYPKEGQAAVKVMIPQEREDATQRFETEWRQLLAINHPHLIEVYGGGYEDRVPWYSMEVVENIMPIKDIRRLPELAKLDLIYQAAGGLEALHQRNIIHRDVKPANLLCCKEGERIRVRVMDLGIAKMAASKEGLTLSHHVMGTPYYMSPEQAGSSKSVDARADIYSLGAALYSLVTGIRPYEGLSMYEIVGHLVRGEGPEKPLHVNAEMNKEVAYLIERMMELDVDRRLQSISTVREAIKAIFEADSPRARQLLARKVVSRKGQKRTRVQAARGGASTSTRTSSQLTALRERRRVEMKRGARKGMSPALLAGGLLTILLLLGGIVWVVAGGGSAQSDSDPFSKTPSQRTTRQGGDENRSQAATREAAEMEAAERAEAQDKARQHRLSQLAKLDKWGGETIQEVESGIFVNLDATLDRMWELVDEDKSEDEQIRSRYQEWKDRLIKGRDRYCNALASQAFKLAKSGKTADARVLASKLNLLNALHKDLPELRKLLDSPPKPTAQQTTSKLLTMQVILDGKPTAVKVQLQKVKAEVSGGNKLLIRPDEEDTGLINVLFEVKVAGQFRVEATIKQVGGTPHFHHAMAVAKAGWTCMRVPITWAAEARNYRLMLMPWKPGTIRLAFGFPTKGGTYEFGPLKITRLFATTGRYPAAKVAQLRKGRKYLDAQTLLEEYQEVAAKPELRKLIERLSLLSQFEGAVAEAQAKSGKSVVPISQLTADQAIRWGRVIKTKDSGNRRAMEAAFLWELGDARALERALSALKKGAKVQALVDEIKKGAKQ